MIVAFASLTGKVKSFANRLSERLPEDQFIHVKKNTLIEEPFVLITYTWGNGEVPREVSKFLLANGSNLVAVVGSGERNWGEHRFCKAAIDIASQYRVPLLHTFEKMGYDSDVDFVVSKIEEIKEG